MKYRKISPEQQARFPQALVIRAEDESDLEVRQEEGATYMDPYFCIDCPVGVKSPLNAAQMADHVLLVHEPRGDLIWDHFKANIINLAAFFKQMKAAEKNQRDKQKAS